MKTTRILVCSSIFALLAGPASASFAASGSSAERMLDAPLSLPLSLQGGKAKPASSKKKQPPKDNPEIPGLLKDLSKIAKDRKGRSDPKGIELLSKLTALFEKLNAKQQKLVAKGVGSVFKAKRPAKSPDLLLAAGEAASRCGDAGAEVLVKAADNRAYKKKPWSLFRAQMIRLIGRPAVKKHAKFLLDIATRDPDDQARAAAGEALGSYSKYPQKLRKKIVDKLVKELSSKFNAKSTLPLGDSQQQDAEDLYAAIQEPWMRTLRKMTGQKQADPVLWLRWYNNNKRKNWDKLGYRVSK